MSRHSSVRVLLRHNLHHVRYVLVLLLSVILLTIMLSVTLAKTVSAQTFTLSVCISPFTSFGSTAHFGYQLRAPNPISQAIGVNNNMSPGPADQGQLRALYPGFHPEAFRLAFAPTATNPTLTWTFQGQSITADWTTPQCADISAPGAPIIGVATAGSGAVSVAFAPPAFDGDSAITGYTATCGSGSASANASPINVTGLVNGVAVTCTVVATNSIGNSAPSAASNSVTPLPSLAACIADPALAGCAQLLPIDQTITFGTQSVTTFSPSGVVALNPLATSTSNLAITYRIDTPSVCSIAAANITIIAAGVCRIIASQLGSNIYRTAPEVTQTITINKANQIALMVSSTASTLVFGGTATLSVAGGSGTGAVTFAANNTNCTINGATLRANSVGQCSVTAIKAADNDFASAVSPSIVISINPLPPPPPPPLTTSSASLSTNVASTPSYGTPFTLNAQINGSHPSGVVNFSVSTSQGNSVVCRDVGMNGGAAACVVPRALRAVGTNIYNVTFDGDARNSGSSANLTLQITEATPVLSLAASPAKPIVGQAVTVTALLGIDDIAGQVTFSIAGVTLAGCAQVSVQALPMSSSSLTEPDTAVASCIIPNIGAGSAEITATYSGSVNNSVAQRKLVINMLADGPRIDYSDMWWAGMAENGWGMSVAQKGKIQFNAFYVYDNDGKPIWTVMPGGSWNSDFTIYSGPLYQPSSSPFSNYDASQFKPGNAIGSAAITFTDTNNATLTYIINGVRVVKQIQRQPFGVTDHLPRLIVNDLWWAGTEENGWGINIAQQARTLFLVWYTYGLDGKTTWFTVPGGVWNGTTFTGDIYTTTSSPWLGVRYDATKFKGTKVGTLVIDFEDANKALMTYTSNSSGQTTTQTKLITRQPF
jgi:hypothetical protein